MGKGEVSANSEVPIGHPESTNFSLQRFLCSEIGWMTGTSSSERSEFPQSC
jgi:hypothetical protein